MRREKSQSAMEYLMTYGWAILIIAVVLGALYSLGVFNMSAYMPKIGPGACHVFRPNGPGSSWNVALTGSCSGYLPQYVAFGTGTGSIDVSTSFPNIYSVTIVGWVKPKSTQQYATGVIGHGGVLVRSGWAALDPCNWLYTGGGRRTRLQQSCFGELP